MSEFIDSDDISTYDRITKQVSNMLQYNSYINILGVPWSE